MAVRTMQERGAHVLNGKGQGGRFTTTGWVWSRVGRPHTKSKSITAATWCLSPFCTDSAHSVWPFPVVRKPTKKLICCTCPYFSLSGLLFFLILLGIYSM